MPHYNLPMYIHPAGFGDAYDDGSGELWGNYAGNLIFGWPFHTTMAIHRLVFGGLLDRFPNLKFVAVHLGGMITFYPERFATHLPIFIDLMKEKIPDRILNDPHRYVKKIYLDTAVFNTPSLNCAYSYSGADHLVFATDYPLGPKLGEFFMRSAVDTISAWQISEGDKEKILWKNAKNLLRLS